MRSRTPKDASFRRAVCRHAIVAFLLLWMLFTLRASAVSPDQTFSFIVNGVISGHRFNLLVWEIQALSEKAASNLRYPSPRLANLDGSLYVQEYIELSLAAGRLQERIERAYAGLPANMPPPDDIVQLEAELSRLRAAQRAMRPLVETIIERQVARTLSRQGLTTGGIVWPPVLFQLSQPPLHLVISPRERIELIRSDDLRAGLSLTMRGQLEDRLDTTLNVSSLIEDIGGYGAYPSMILEHTSLTWLINAVAHEWTHNYLAFKPLGWRYERSSAMRTINETVATLVGDEIGALVIEAYYPWITPPALSWQTPHEREEEAPPEAEPSRFDYGRFMRETRLEADRLLAAGDIEGAERYMEQRRRILLEQGYVIRKLNQAYFAFHGLYAIGPGAVDPIGPKIEELRRRTSSLQEFVRTVEAFQSPEDLDRALGLPEEAQ